jgi:hypothetical protein
VRAWRALHSRDPRPSTKVKITSGKAAPKNNWIWTQKLKQQHGSGVGSLVHTAESRQGTNTDSLCTHEKKFARRKQATNPVKLTAHTNSRNRKMKSRKHGNRSWTKSGRSNPRRLERRKKNQAAKKMRAERIDRSGENQLSTKILSRALTGDQGGALRN